jgi:hypothetical protein
LPLAAPLPEPAAPLLPLPPPRRAQVVSLELVQSCGENTSAASSAAVGAPGALPVADTPAAEPSLSAVCAAPCKPSVGNAASASTTHFGMTSVDAG